MVHRAKGDVRSESVTSIWISWFSNKNHLYINSCYKSVCIKTATKYTLIVSILYYIQQTLNDSKYNCLFLRSMIINYILVNTSIYGKG